MKLETSIILTLAYSAQFGQALSAKHIRLRLINYSNLENTQRVIDVALDRLEETGLILNQNNNFTLKGFDRAFQNTKQGKINSNKYWLEAIKLKKFLSKIPWISGVAITGSVAVDFAKVQDDLDLMIVTQAHRLWLTRLILSLYLIVVNKKKPRGFSHRSGWCFNLWLSQENLSMPVGKRSLYTAYEFIQAVWIIGSKQLLESLTNDNLWVWHKIPMAQLNITRLKLVERKTGKKNLGTRLLDLLNHIAYLAQSLYMSSHQTNELVIQHAAFFHPLDTKKTIYQNWRRTILIWIKTTNTRVA